MRVVVVSHMFPSKFNLDDVFIYQQVKALKDLGIEVRVLQPVPWVPCFLPRRARWERYHLKARDGFWGGVDTIRVTYPHPPTALLQPFAPIGLLAPLVISLRSIQQQFEFDLIHAHTLSPDGLASVLAGRLLHKPVIVSARGSDVHTYPHRGPMEMLVARSTIMRCDKLIAVSRKLASQASELMVRRDPVDVIYNGVDTDVFTPCEDKAVARVRLGLPKSGSLALTVGALVREKGILELIYAFELLSRTRPDFRLVVVGAGLMRAELEALRSRVGEDRIFLPGVVPNERVAHYMRAADVLIHPSHAEGLPNVMLEAMATGLPVIGTIVGGIPEVITHEKTGLLVNAKDPEALANRIRLLLDDEQMAKKIGIAGRNRVVHEHSWKQNAEKHIQVYRSVMEHFGGS